MENIKPYTEIVRKAFPRVYIEVSGICNAKCPYCVTGAKNQPEGKFIKPEIFRKLLGAVINTGLFERNFSSLFLYRWGEPFLHPDFSKITDIINDFAIKYIICTNGSVLPEINRNTVENLEKFHFSMPGFSQNSYDRIHGFSLDEIKKNIVSIVNKLRENSYDKEIIILYHIYRFNMNELEACQEFAGEYDIKVFPYYAGIMDFWQQMALIEGTMEDEKLKNLSRDFFLDYYYAFFNIKKEKCTLHRETFSVDEYGNVATCCLIPTNHPCYSCGNLLKDNLEDILIRKFSQPFCRKCMDYGMAFDSSWDHKF